MSPVRGKPDLASNHPIGKDLFGNFGGWARTYFATITQNRDPVADLHYFMQFVRNKDERVTVLHHLLHDDKQLVDFLWSKNSGRLIQDQKSGAAIKCFDNFNALLLSHRKLPDIRIWVNLQAVNLSQFHNPFRNAIKIGERAASG